MTSVFVDTFFWLAMLDAGDDWHDNALVLDSQLRNVRRVTTYAVLLEVLNSFAGRGSILRNEAYKEVQKILSRKTSM